MNLLANGEADLAPIRMNIDIGWLDEIDALTELPILCYFKVFAIFFGYISSTFLKKYAQCISDYFFYYVCTVLLFICAKFDLNCLVRLVGWGIYFLRS